MGADALLVGAVILLMGADALLKKYRTFGRPVMLRGRTVTVRLKKKAKSKQCIRFIMVRSFSFSEI